jgi:acetyl/propionyl-CoA carboxylase alpha subunit
MIEKLLIANRGEIARRIIRTCRRLGIQVAVAYSDADAQAPFVSEADEAVPIGGSTAAESYLDGEKIVAAAIRIGADAVHPGYGFLSEDASFARRVREAGLIFVGPRPETIAAMGSKVKAKAMAQEAGVPVLPMVVVEIGAKAHSALATAGITGRVIIKASAGGGGRGMRLVEADGDLAGAIESAAREAQSSFGDATLFIEPYIDSPRHIEIQILGDSQGEVIDLYERECSIQRRHQKIIEESPSIAIDHATRKAMGEAAIRLAKAIGYENAGTVEFIVAPDGRFYFLEVNTRLQVEHPVTEAVTGVDLVALQLAIAVGGRVPSARPEIVGHAIEARLYAEDPLQNWMPVTGTVRKFEIPPWAGIRVDSGVEPGTVIGPYYDSMLAKVISHADTREHAAAQLATALAAARIHGITTNRDLLVQLLRHPDFRSGAIDTHFLDRHPVSDLVSKPQRTHADQTHAIALAVWLRESRPDRGGHLPGMVPAWRNVPSALQRVDVEAASGLHISVSYGLRDRRLEIAVDGEQVENVVVERTEVTGCELVIGGIRRRYHVNGGPEIHYVDSALGSSTFRVLPRFRTQAESAIEGSLAAPMPGIVVRVEVEAGQQVERGDPLVVVEAMKMEHTIAAPHAGRVAEIRVRPGQTVAAGELLAVLDKQSSG